MVRRAKPRMNTRRSTGERERDRRRNRTADDNETPEWVIDINNCLREGTGFDLGRAWTMYRVPKNMLEIYKSAYIPKIISVGPFHNGDPWFQAMEEHKMRYLLRLLGFTREENGEQLDGSSSSSSSSSQQVQINKIQLDSLAGAMKKLERKTRERYSETFVIESDDFVQMMVLDGCFVIELLRLYHKFDMEKIVDDPIFTTRWMLRTLQRDLLMLENQLPFFLLEELFKLTSSGEETSLIELALNFFDPLMPRDKEMLEVNHEIEYQHLLDLFRTSFLSSIQLKKPVLGWKQPQTSASLTLVQERQLIHCVTELQETRVKFNKAQDRELLDIEFGGGVLHIPPLYLDDNTVPLFLNFVAYEQSDENAEPYFTNHFMFFDSLVNSATDVEILHKYGIINHVLGSDKDIANLFNKLGREIVYDVDDCHLSKQMKGVNDYYKAYYATKWHVWWTKLIRSHFSSPWTFLSLLAAIVLLLLTASQSFFAFFAYFRPP